VEPEPKHESRSSIELSRTKDGVYSWRVKVYLESNRPEDIAAAKKQVFDTDEWLREEYLMRPLEARIP
jgi:hypothetical protein